MKKILLLLCAIFSMALQFERLEAFSAIEKAAYAQTIVCPHCQCPFSLEGEDPGDDVGIWADGVGLCHANGAVAWLSFDESKQFTGYYYDGTYYHSNGHEVWGGVIQHKTSYWDHSGGKFYHSNGKLAWGGIVQDKTSYWDHSGGKFYHSNGKLAWGGVIQDKCGYYDQSGGKFYHSNGKLAWNGRKGDPVFNDEGKKISGGASELWLYLGDGSWLYGNYQGEFVLSLQLGEEVTLQIDALGQHTLIICGFERIIYEGEAGKK